MLQSRTMVPNSTQSEIRKTPYLETAIILDVFAIGVQPDLVWQRERQISDRRITMTSVLSLRPLYILFALFALVWPMSQAQAQTVDVRFPRGSSGTTVEGSISGDQSIKYRLGVSAGQLVSVQLDSDNASNYFNITAPGASQALYNSSMDGNGTSFAVPSSGNYTITVYLMRNAARRHETANYNLTLYVENAGTPAPRPRAQNMTPPSGPSATRLSPSDMPRYCAGEASAKFSVRPTEITTNMAFQSGDRYVSQGYFDGASGTTFFNCWFGLDGSFQFVN